MQQCKIQTTGRWKKIFVPCIPGYILTLPNWDFKYPEKWGILALFGNKTPRLKQISKYKYKMQSMIYREHNWQDHGKEGNVGASSSESSDLSLSSGNTIFNKQPNIGKWDKEMLPSVKMWESKRFRGSYPFSTSHIHISGAYLYW